MKDQTPEQPPELSYKTPELTSEQIDKIIEDSQRQAQQKAIENLNHDLEEQLEKLKKLLDYNRILSDEFLKSLIKASPKD